MANTTIKPYIEPTKNIYWKIILLAVSPHHAFKEKCAYLMIFRTLLLSELEFIIYSFAKLPLGTNICHNIGLIFTPGQGLIIWQQQTSSFPGDISKNFPGNMAYGYDSVTRLHIVTNKKVIISSKTLYPALFWLTGFSKVLLFFHDNHKQ